jgi:hypothetical protein
VKSDEASVAYDILEVTILGCHFVVAKFGWKVFRMGHVVIWSLMT